MDKNYLDSDDIVDYVIDSWSRCIENKLAREINRNNIDYQEISNYELNIYFFRELVSFVSSMLKKDIIFLLTDKDGVLLDLAGTKKIKKQLLSKGIKRGFSFSEKYIGTNAVSLVSQTGQPVYLDSKYHYCNFFKKWYSFALQLKKDGKITGYLCIMTVNKCLKRNIIIIGKLIAYIMTTRHNINRKNEFNRIYKLSKRQVQILKLIGSGLTEKATAAQLKLSTSTIKYHKKVLLNRLNVNSSIEAIIRALKLGLISVDDIKLRN